MTGPNGRSSGTDAIAWDTAERIAIRVAGREPLAESYHYASLEPDFREFTAEAEALVEAETGLKSLAGPARARVPDRAGWIRANLASFQRLLRQRVCRGRFGRHGLEREMHALVTSVLLRLAGLDALQSDAY